MDRREFLKILSIGIGTTIVPKIITFQQDVFPEIQFCNAEGKLGSTNTKFIVPKTGHYLVDYRNGKTTITRLY